jgi:LCP family protein required for cell wall assembly
MKKKLIVLYAVIAVGAGILTGLSISHMFFSDQEAPIKPGVIDENIVGENKQNDNKPNKNEGNAIDIDHNITNKQRYYKPLVSNATRNVLLIGEDAYSGNYDTIIIASISEKDKKVQLFNFPRDIYIDYSQEVLSKLEQMSPKLYTAKGFQKINAAPNVGASIKYKSDEGRFGNSRADFLADLIEELFGITIHDYAYVNTKGFREVVDLFGGVEINVPIRMKYDDPMQDLYIDLEKGIQRLNGEQAEWFVRFRQGYNEKGEFKNYSDTFRKENQNEFLKAFFKQHVNVKNVGKIDELVKLLGNNIKTSVDNIKDITFYANMLGKALTGKYDLESSIIECLDAKMINGVYFDIIRSE